MSPYEIEIDKSAIEALIKLIKDQPVPLSWELTVARSALEVALDPSLDSDLWESA